MKLLEIEKEYEYSMKQHDLYVDQIKADISRTQIGVVSSIKLESRDDLILKKRMAIIGIVMVWEDYLNKIFLLLEVGKIRSNGILSSMKDIAIKKKDIRDRLCFDYSNKGYYIEKYDFIRIYRNYVLHNNCTKKLFVDEKSEDEWRLLHDNYLIDSNDSYRLDISPDKVDFIKNNIMNMKKIISNDIL